MKKQTISFIFLFLTQSISGLWIKESFLQKAFLLSPKVIHSAMICSLWLSIKQKHLFFNETNSNRDLISAAIFLAIEQAYQAYTQKHNESTMRDYKALFYQIRILQNYHSSLVTIWLFTKGVVLSYENHIAQNPNTPFNIDELPNSSYFSASTQQEEYQPLYAIIPQIQIVNTSMVQLANEIINHVKQQKELNIIHAKLHNLMHLISTLAGYHTSKINSLIFELRKVSQKLI